MSHIRIRKGSTLGKYLLPEIDYRASMAVRANDQVFLTGATGLTLDGTQFIGNGDPAMQAEQAMKVVRILLEESGARMKDICKVTTYVTDHNYRKQVYPVLADHLRGVNPVSTGLVVSGLAQPEMDFEIDVFAVVSNNSKEHRRIRLFNNQDVEGSDPSFPNLEDCTKFYVCLNGITPQEASCNNGQVFDEKKMLCGLPETVPEW